MTFVKTQDKEYLRGGEQVNEYQQDRAGPITVSMKPALVKKLTALAERRGQTRSALVRDLVEKELDRTDDDGRQDQKA